MSINHFSSELPETLRWSQQQQPFMEPNPNTPSSKLQPNSSWTSQLYNHNHQVWLCSYNPQEPSSMVHNRNPTLNFNLNNQEDDEELDDNTDNFTHQEHHQEQEQEQEVQELDKEPMFEKPLTPSDVGKLNRLVIPKQHAEKYFPLGGDSGDKGLLLSFEDESGKCWRFRYSYWNSSQSYVLTKGWSRYVKEKRLDAGDVVLFERHRSDSDRLFIGWRRRGVVVQDSSAAAAAQSSGGGGGRGGWTRVFYSAHPYPTHHGHGPPVPYQPDSIHAGYVAQNQSTPAGNSKTLRLFGVNLECQLDESEPSTSDGSSLSSQGQTQQQFYSQAYSSNHHNHMDITLSQDVNQMRNRRG